MVLSTCCHRVWQKDPRPFTYKRVPGYADGVEQPKPPKLVVAGSRAAADAEKAIRANAASGSSSGCGPFLPPEHANAPLWDKDSVICTREEVDDAEYGPHTLLARLNCGKLPYRVQMVKQPGNKERVSKRQGGS